MTNTKKILTSPKDLVVYADAIVWSKGRTSLFFDKNASSLINNPANLKKFYADPELTIAAVTKLKGKGFTVLSVGRTGVSFQGTDKLFNDFFHVTIHKKPDTGDIIIESNGIKNALPNMQIDTKDTEFSDVLAGVFLSQPSVLYSVPEAPESVVGIRPKEIINQFQQAEDLINAENRGLNSTIAIVDSGFFTEHKFFGQFFRQPLTHNLTKFKKIGGKGIDYNGHGTMMLANAISIAPEATFELYSPCINKNDFDDPGKMQEYLSSILSDIFDNRYNSIANKIYSISWGPGAFPLYLKLQAAYMVAHKNATWVFAIGNYNTNESGFAFELGSYSIVVGGAFWKYQNGVRTLEASDYSRGRLDNKPTICGYSGPREVPPHNASKYSRLALPVPLSSLYHEQFNGVDGWISSVGGHTTGHF